MYPNHRDDTFTYGVMITWFGKKACRLPSKSVRPRRGSNAQPPDSKSVTLSIELRGLMSICNFDLPILPDTCGAASLGNCLRDNVLAE